VKPGTKFDGEKPRWELLPLSIIEGAVKVFGAGAVKYTDHGWQTVPRAPERYFAALMRHLTRWQAGERFDPEDGLPHLDHALCDLIIMAWHDRRGWTEKQKTKTSKYING
jgi:hypothetical protein